MCLFVQEIESVGASQILPLLGGYSCPVVFSMAIFRPFPGEVLEGVISASVADGLCVQYGGWFSDIIVPKIQMNIRTFFLNGQWVWQFDSGETQQSFPLKVGASIRVRVVKIEYNSHTSGVAQNSDAPRSLSPMRIIAAINEDGLGLVDWWD